MDIYCPVCRLLLGKFDAKVASDNQEEIGACPHCESSYTVSVYSWRDEVSEECYTKYRSLSVRFTRIIGSE